MGRSKGGGKRGGGRKVREGLVDRGLLSEKYIWILCFGLKYIIFPGDKNE